MRDALDWQTEDAMKCRGCGHPLDETTAPGRDNAYDVELIACHACATTERALRAQREKGEIPGLLTRVKERG